jgi:hypothetical protein
MMQGDLAAGEMPKSGINLAQSTASYKSCARRAQLSDTATLNSAFVPETKELLIDSHIETVLADKTSDGTIATAIWKADAGDLRPMWLAIRSAKWLSY